MASNGGFRRSGGARLPDRERSTGLRLDRDPSALGTYRRDVTHLLFSFGTLRLAPVQQELFGRSVPTTPDALHGHALSEVVITDPAVIRMSGSDRHPGLVRTGNDADVVEGAVLEIDDVELAAADRYEEVAYRRAAVTLRSGREAWVYLPKG